ncbi:MAG: hypothetical protein MUF58_17500 [Arcicella sp.]|jgi:hypothetical protein|nr:hypothetical protein [Arcicella sp.]
MEVPDSKVAEIMAHFKLKEYHSKKEYFNISVIQAVNILEKFLPSFFEIEKPLIHRSKYVEAYPTLIDLLMKLDLSNE